MTEAIEIRDSRPGDLPAIEQLYPAAFPDEDLLPVVRDLLEEGSDVLSLVALCDEALVGHVAFTPCNVADRPEPVALLAPLAVLPTHQRQGVGSALVRGGLARLTDAGAARVLVLGDPAYYGRFGFGPDTDVDPPYPLPKEWRNAWQSLGLRDDAPPLQGELRVPEPWRRRELWSG